MVKKILTAAGFVEGKTFKETRFLKPPKSTYCIYMDSVERRGADDVNLIKEHMLSIELYSYVADSEAEKRIETEFDARGIPYTKQPRYWLDTEQLYQVVYDFNYFEK